MASNNMSEELSFLSRIKKVEEVIKNKFSCLNYALKVREADLLAELERIKATYTGEGVNEQIDELVKSRDQISISVKRNENETTLKLSVALLDARIREIREQSERDRARIKGVVFEWDKEVDDMVTRFGGIRVKSRSDNSCLIVDTPTVKVIDKGPSSPLYFNCEDGQLILELRMELCQLKLKEKEAKEALDKSNEIIDYLHTEKKRLENELRFIRESGRLSGNETPPIPPKLTKSFSCEPVNIRQPEHPFRNRTDFSQITHNGTQVITLPLSQYAPKERQLIGYTVYCKPSPHYLNFVRGILQCCFKDSVTDELMAGVNLFENAGDSDGVYKRVRYFNTEANRAVFLPSGVIFVQESTRKV